MKNNNIDELKEKYPVGCKIRLLETMDDLQAIKAGQVGELEFIDDIGSLHMRWDNGSGLAIIPEHDKFEVIEYPEKIKVIIVEPEKDPYVKEIYNTLKAKQEIVEGRIQCIPSMFSDEISYDFIVNEENKLLGLPCNRFIYDKQDAVFGNMIIAKADENTGEYISISDTEVNFIMDKLEEKCPKFNMSDLENILYQEQDMEGIDIC